MATAIFLIHLAATLLMTGVIWIVQVVHYPLFAAVGAEAFRDYESQHQQRITLVVAPLMLIELATAVALVLWTAPAEIPAWMPLAGLILVGVVWLSTAFVQVPAHRLLESAFDGDAHRRLVATNWIRTVAWSLRTGLVLWMLVLVVS